MSGLDELFASFENKRAEKTAKTNAEDAAKERGGQEAIQAFQSIVIPTLNEYADDINARGYSASVIRDIGSSQPCVRFTLSVDTSDFPLGKPWSQVTFVYTRPGSLDIRQEIRSPGREDAECIDTTATVSSLSVDKIRDVALSFVRMALDAHLKD